MKWFNNPQTLEELKKQYKKLAIKHHPDRGGNTADMQQINNEYDKLFEKLKDIHTTADGKTYTAQQTTTETPEEFRNIIDVLIRLDGIKIEVIGSWLWVTGNTFIQRDTLKSMKFRFSKSKTAWYFHGNDYHKTSKKTFTLEQIRSLYGSEVVTGDPELKLQIV